MAWDPTQYLRFESESTRLRPYLDALDPAEHAEFRAEVASGLREAFPRKDYGTVLPFRRLRHRVPSLIRLANHPARCDRDRLWIGSVSTAGTTTPGYAARANSASASARPTRCATPWAPGT